MRPPTEKQFLSLCMLADPRLKLVSGATGDYRRLLRRGWLIAETPDSEPPNGVTITPDGLRALAVGLEQHGHTLDHAEGRRRRPEQ